MRATTSWIALLVLVFSSTAGAEDGFELGTGFRHDGSGVWPVQSAPTKWSKSQNIAWELETKHWGASGFCFADGKLFTTRDPIIGDEEEFGAQLLCIDPRRGEVLWQRGVNQLELHPAPLARKIRKAWTEEMQMLRDYREHLRRLRDLKSSQKSEIIATVKALRDLGVKAKSDKHPLPFDGRKPHNYHDPARWLPLRASGRKERMKFLSRHGCDHVAWSDSHPDNGSRYMGLAFPTPTTDGECVYVRTGHHVLACFDLEGNKRWLIQFSKKSGYTSYAPSPIVVDDMLVVYTVGSRSSDRVGLRVFDKRTGKQRYELPQSDWASSYKLGQPAIFTLPGISGPLAYLPDGRIVALRDGQVLADKIGWMCGGDNPLVVGDTLFCLNRQEGGGYGGKKHGVPEGLTAYRLKAEGGKVSAKQVWHNGDVSGHGLVHYNGLLFGCGRSDIMAVDPASGKVVGKRGRVKCGAWNLEVAAGKLYAAANKSKGYWSVLSADRELRVLAKQNDLSQPKRKDNRGRMRQPVVSRTCTIAFYGNVAFIRQLDRIYAVAEGGLRLPSGSTRASIRARPERKSAGASTRTSRSKRGPAVRASARGTGKPPASVVRDWEPKLLELVEESVDAGEQPRFRWSSMRARVRIVGVNDNELELQMRGMRLACAPKRLSLQDKSEIAEQVADREDAEQAAVAAFFHLAAGNEREASVWLNRAGTHAAAVRSQVQQ